jgi:hypothetical protein
MGSRMTDTIIKGPWVPRRPDTPLTPDQRRRQDDRNKKAASTRDDVRNWKRMLWADKLKVAQNLGDLIVELGRDLGLSEARALERVWEAYGRPDRWNKKLRYVRMPSDYGKKSDEIVSTFIDFLSLGEVVAGLQTKGALTDEERKNEALLRLLQGTSRDPDPHQSAKIDFDAARAVADLADAFVRQVEEAVPGLKEYFVRLAKYQLFHRRWPEDVYRERFWASMPSWHKSIHNTWNPSGDDEEWPVDVDTSEFVAEFTGNQPPGHGPADTMPETFLYDDMPVVGDSDHRGVVGLLPRILLGTIGGFGLALLKKSHWPIESLSEDRGDSVPHPIDVVRTIDLAPHQIFLTIQPILGTDGIKLEAGVLAEQYPFKSYERDELGQDYLVARTYGEAKMNPTTERWGPFVANQFTAIPMWDMPTDVICLIQSESAKRVLGLGDTQGSEQLADELLYKPQKLEDLTQEFLSTTIATVSPSIKIGHGFTPFKANSLAAALFSNLLYVKGEESALNMMIADARSRVETLDNQFRLWMRDFQTAKSDFVAGMGQTQSHKGEGYDTKFY